MHDAARHAADASARLSSQRMRGTEIDVPSSAHTAARPSIRMGWGMGRMSPRGRRVDRGGGCESVALLQLGVAVDELQVVTEGRDPPPLSVALQLEVVAADEHARVPARLLREIVIGDAIAERLRPVAVDADAVVAGLVVDRLDRREPLLPAGGDLLAGALRRGT